MFRYAWEFNLSSTQDLRLLGQLKFGLYSEPGDGIHPEVLKYYGTTAEARVENTLNADVIRQIREEQVSKSLHKAVDVSPFMDRPREVQVFGRVLEQFEASGFIPLDHSLRSKEWDNDGESIPFGKRRGKELCVPLPTPIWLPRAIQRVRCLYIMDYIIDSR